MAGYATVEHVERNVMDGGAEYARLTGKDDAGADFRMMISERLVADEKALALLHPVLRDALIPVDSTE